MVNFAIKIHNNLNIWYTIKNFLRKLQITKTIDSFN